MGYTNLNFKKSKVRIQFYQNPRFRDKILTISSLKFHVIHTKSILKVISIQKKNQSSIPWLAWLLFSSSLPFFFSSSSSSSLLLPSGSPQMRPIWSFKNPDFVKALFGPLKTHFWVKFAYLLLSPPTLGHLYSKFSLFHFGLKLINSCLLGPFLDKFQFCP